MKSKITLFAIVLLSNFMDAQTTSIPDPSFEQVLLNQNIDTDGVINGQINTADALAVTTLNITSPNGNGIMYINDLTGIEAFTSVDTLRVNGTMIEELNVSTLANLKYLDCTENMLSSIDVSNNALLEYLNISSDGDVMPINNIDEIDLSNNPAIKNLIAVGGINYINLKNSNNNSDLDIDISAGSAGFGIPEDVILGNTCIEVDNETLTQDNQLPYYNWTISNANKSYSLVETCTAGTQKFKKADITLYPNPAADTVTLTTSDTFTDAAIYTTTGQKVKQLTTGSAMLTTDVSSLNAGIYFIKVKTQSGISTKKLIVQ